MDMPMQCDATILQCDATILKEKIIKTDTLLQKYQENSSKLKKATELCKYLKKKYEEAKLSLEVSQLENERAKFKLENIQSKHHEVEVENTRLSKELVELGEQYQKYTLEAQAEIKSLQHGLKNLNKLKQCTPDTDNKVEHLEGKLKKLQLAEKNYKAKIDKLTNQQKEIYKKHGEEKCILSKQIEKLESQIKNDHEKCNLKPKPLNNSMNLKGPSSEKIQTITDLNQMMQDKSVIYSGESNGNLLKALNDLQLANHENETLRHQLNMKNREIAALKIKRFGTAVSVQTEKIVDNLKDTNFTEICNNDLGADSDLNDIVHENLNVNEPNKNYNASPDLTNIMEEHSQEIVCKTSNAVSIKKSVVSTKTESFDTTDSDALKALKLANTDLKQQLNIKNREIAALLLKKLVVSVYVQTEKVIDKSEVLCHTEGTRDYFPDLSSESDFEDIDDAKEQLETHLQKKQSQNKIHTFGSTKHIHEKIDGIPPNKVLQNALSETKKLSFTSAICDMSTQTETLHPGLFTRKPKIAVKSTQAAVKTVSFAVQTEHKYVSLSTQTDSDSVSKCIDNFIQNDPAASDEESISDILSEMKNIPRLLSPITDMFDSKMPDTKNTIDKKNNHFAKRNWRRAIHTSRSYPSKYLPWKRRMILKNVRLNITRDPVAKALQILKRAKINFTISNERILTHPRDYSRQQVLPQNQPVESKKIFVEKLSRCYSSCATGYTHMRLSKTGGCTELLGFFTEEKKCTTQTNVDIASHTTQKNSNLKERTDFVDETAKIVISKLKEEFNLIPKIKRMRKLSSSDSEMSEFANGGFSTERSAKKIKKFKSMKRRRYSQKEDTTSGFESSCTPLTQCSTMSSQQLDIKSTENQLQESPNNFSPNLQNITTPVAPLSDIIDNQLFESNISIDPSLVDSESQTINQYNVQPNPHINEELIDGHMQKISNGDIPEVNKQKCDLKLPQNKHEEGKISDTVAGIKKLKPRKKRKPMSKLKSKTLRQFKQKMLMFQTENPIIASVGHKTNNANPTQNKFISEATTEKFPDIKSQNGKTQDIKANKSNRSRRDVIGQDSSEKNAVEVLVPETKQTFDPLYIDSSRISTETKEKLTHFDDIKIIHQNAKSKQYKNPTKVKDKGGGAKEMSYMESPKSKIPSCDFNSRNQTINVDNFKFDDKSRTQEMQPDISVNKKHDKSTGNCSDNLDLPRKVHLKNKKSNTLRANRRRMCDTKFDTAKADTFNLTTNCNFTQRKSNTSLQCNEPLKNGTEIDPVQSSNGQHVGPYLKFLNAIGKFEQERTMNIDDHKNEKSVDKCYNPDQSVRGVIQPDIDFSLKDSNANKTPDSGRRSSRRLMKSNITSGTTSVQTSSKESLTVTKNSTAISVEHCGTNSTEIDGQKANVDVYPDLNIKHTKIDSDIESIVPTDLPQVSLCDVIDSPVSPESFSEPEDYDIKIIPLYPTETINNTENYINNENYVKEETKIPINENTTQNKFQVGKRSEPSVIRRSKRKEISVLQNIVIRPSNPTIVNKKEDEFDQSDIMSKIIDDMNKSKRLSVKNKDPNICNVSPTNHKLDDKEWRRMILDVAELIHCDEEMLNFDLRPFESRITPHIYLKTRSLLAKTTILIKKLKATNESENVRDELITEFKRFSPETVVNIILYGLTNDKDKTLNTYHPLLLLTKLQWLFLKLIIQLEEANMRNIFELYLQTAEPLLYRKCNLTTVVPLTRFYVAICKLHGNVNQVRKLCCEAFYYMADLAVILLHTVLISWIEIFPMQDNVKCFPIAEVMAQLIHLKNINKGDYKLQSLKALLNQYYGYPDERLDCDVFFKALVRKYLCNPVRILNFAIRLYCKYKNNCWLKQIINHVFKPLVYKIPVENEEFKATVIVLLANICEQLKIISTDKYIVELRAWFSSLSEGETPQLIQHSVEYALSKLNFTKTQQKKTKKATPKKQKKAIPKKKKNAKPKKKKSLNLSRHKTNP